MAGAGDGAGSTRLSCRSMAPCSQTPFNPSGPPGCPSAAESNTHPLKTLPPFSRTAAESGSVAPAGVAVPEPLSDPSRGGTAAAGVRGLRCLRSPRTSPQPRGVEGRSR